MTERLLKPGEYHPDVVEKVIATLSGVSVGAGVVGLGGPEVTGVLLVYGVSLGIIGGVSVLFDRRDANRAKNNLSKGIK